MNGVIIQARMTSTRFPGKSMALLAGKPVLRHVIERAQRILFVNKIIVAMPAAKESEPMGALCEQMGSEVFFGSENDVLRRYYLAATRFDLTTIMRITGDCPFLDPVVCGEVLALLKAENLDYADNVTVRTYPKGLDCQVFSYDCLESAHLTATDSSDREHVCPWMMRTDGIRRGCVRQRIDVSSENWCVDFPNDIPRLEAMLAEAERRWREKNPLPDVGRPFTTEELLDMEAGDARH
jgi:spore coat polysaccharide biosynthesis protein SpsF